MKYLLALGAIVALALIVLLGWSMAVCVPTPAPPLPSEPTHSVLENR